MLMIANFCADLFFMYSILDYCLVFVGYISPKLTGYIGSFFKSFLSVVSKVLPIDIITLIIEFIPSDLFDAAKILQKQFPAQKNIIESFTASEKFKNLTVKYNNYSRDILQVLVDLPKRTLLNVDGINTAEKLRM